MGVKQAKFINTYVSLDRNRKKFTRQPDNVEKKTTKVSRFEQNKEKTYFGRNLTP